MSFTKFVLKLAVIFPLLTTSTAFGKALFFDANDGGSFYLPAIEKAVSTHVGAQITDLRVDCGRSGRCLSPTIRFNTLYNNRPFASTCGSQVHGTSVMIYDCTGDGEGGRPQNFARNAYRSMQNVVSTTGERPRAVIQEMRNQAPTSRVSLRESGAAGQ